VITVTANIAGGAYIQFISSATKAAVQQLKGAVMFRKFAIAAVAVATMATAAVTITPNEAHAKNRRGGAIAAGAIIGLAAGAIIASQAQPRYYQPVRCQNRPVTRWSPYHGRYIVVGYQRVCY
jgi:hypothetical protein